MVKNCGDGVHFQIVERNILQEMIKIVKKKALSYLVEVHKIRRGLCFSLLFH